MEKFQNFKTLKSTGILQDFNPSKIINFIHLACNGTQYSAVDLFTQIADVYTDGMKTSDISKATTKAIAERISPETPDLDLVAGRLEMMTLRKLVFGSFDVPLLKDLVQKNIERGFYDPELGLDYTDEDWENLEEHINHHLDFAYRYAGAKQVIEKYLVKDRSTKEIVETPQFAYMCQGIACHGKDLDKVKKYYDAVSQFKLSIPTPIFAGLRTPTRTFSSCVVVDSGDSLNSINEVNGAIVDYISKRAGIGVNGGRIRAEGEKIRSGEVVHTGVIPFWKTFNASVKSSSQGGIRGGSATLTYPMWHLEVENLLVLKNNRGTEESRIRTLDYSVTVNNTMIKRLINNGYITLFSPNVLGGQLYEAYHRSEEEFEELYCKLEKDDSVRKQKIKATTLFSVLMQERIETGRIYISFINNVNDQNKFEEPIYLSNLCQEIALVTKPLFTRKTKTGNRVPEGEIALCSLAAVNVGAIEDLEELEEVCDVAVNLIDSLFEYQEYPVQQAENHAKKRRSIGIGVTNFAYYLAKNFAKYSDGSGNKLTHELFEALQYFCLKASCKLAKEKGKCAYFEKTKYAQGYLPIDLYNKAVDKIIKPEYRYDWEGLRQEIAEYGLRNSVLTAQMPCESSSQVTNSTNGLEPPRQLVTVKQSKDGTLTQIIPELTMYGDMYETAWEMSKVGMKGYIELMCIAQKFIDQAISTNMYYTPSQYLDGKLPLSIAIDDILYYWSLGGKNLYYHNTNDGSEEGIEVKDDCESCKI